MPHDPYKALYIHIPFCASKCDYCDFASSANHTNSEIDSYVENLVEDIRQNCRNGELSDIETVYVGGGTPSFVSSKNLTQLLYALGLSLNLTTETECTIEANPDSIDARLVADIWALGANRISLGVQSFDDKLLREIGRIHTSDDALRAIETAQTRFENVSVDLMCGLPNQTREQHLQSVKRAIEAGVTHISVYPLTIEPGTKLAKKMKRGQLHLPSDDEVVDMMLDASKILKDAGFSRYEVASYAKPGYECKHNIAYWSGLPYLGIGHSAATMTQNSERRMRIKDGEVECDLSPVEMAAEDLMLAMRMSRGVTLSHLNAIADKLPRAKEVFENLATHGFVEMQNDSWIPTEKGWLFGNVMYGEILDLAD